MRIMHKTCNKLPTYKSHVDRWSDGRTDGWTDISGVTLRLVGKLSG